MAELTLKYGDEVVYPYETPTKEATAEYTYIFDKWVTEPNGTIEDKLTNVTGGRNIYASYTAIKNKYTIKFVNWDNTELQSSEVEYGATPKYTGANPTRPATAEYTYTFSGWNPKVTEVTGEATYTAVFTETKNKYTITWKNWDNSILDTDSVEYGEVPQYTGETPIKEADAENTYTFVGWEPEIVAVTEDASYTAVFESTTNKYVVTFYSEDGTQVLGTSLVNYGETASYPNSTPTKEATAEYTYTFSKWVTAPNGTVEDDLTNVVANRNVYASFTATKNKYTIKFVNWDNTELQSSEVEYGVTPKYTGANPTRPATPEYIYTFSGWKPVVAKVTGNATYTAEYTSTYREYLIIFFDESGAAVLAELTLKYGDEVVYPYETPTKEATAEYTYIFDKWVTEPNGTIEDKLTSVVESRNIYASFIATKNKYTITWKNWDNSILDTDSVEYGEVPQYTRETPIKEADAENTYAFVGWEPEVVAVIGEATYTAVFESTTNKYAVTFYNEDGSQVLGTSLVNYGETASYPNSTPTKEATAEYTYTFSKWVTAPNGTIEDDLTNVVANRNVYASFTATKNKYTIKFVNWDNTELQSSEVEYGVTPKYTGENPTRPATPEYIYTFSGWKPVVAEVTGNATYTAEYTSTYREYVIIFFDESGAVVLAELTLKYGDEVVYPYETPTKEATAEYTYIFDKWVTEPNGTIEDKLTSVVESRNIYASYTAIKNKYTITWKNWDNSILDTDSVEYGEVPQYTGETPIKEADAENTYAFVGWEPEIVAVTEDATYTAVFESTTNKYVVTFYSEDGSQVLGTSLVNYGETASYPNSTPTKEASAEYTYTFSKWVTAPNGTIEDDLTNVVANRNVYASFTATKNKYTIKFVNWDNTELQSNEVEYGETPIYTGTTPTRPATAEYTYTFSGWNPEVTEVTGEATYTAVFTETKNKYTITWKNWDNSILDTDSVEYGEVPQYTGETPIKEADAENTYTFVGWEPEIVAVTEDASYTAVFESTTNKYVVTFYSEDGTQVLGTSLVNYGETASYPNSTPTKEATAEYTYTFSKWVTAPNGTIEDDLTNIVANRNVYASFIATKNKYIIKFVNWDNSELQSNEVEYGETPIYTGTTPTKESTAEYTYTFIGWEPQVVAVTCDATYIAVFEESTATYLITWLNYNGTILDTDLVGYGDMPEYKGQEPTRPSSVAYSYNFIGWSPELTVVTEDATYTAVYAGVLNQFTVTFYNDDGTIVLGTSIVSYGGNAVYQGQTPTKPSTSNYRYTFNKWVTEAGGTIEANLFNITSNINVYASFTALKNTFKVKVNVMGPCQVHCEQDLENITYGDSRTFIIDANLNDYEVEVYVNNNMVEVIGNIFVLNNITEDTEISVKLVKKPLFETTTGSIIIISGIVAFVMLLIAIPLINAIKKKNRYKKMSGL